jgi:hypothetical protein
MSRAVSSILARPTSFVDLESVKSWGIDSLSKARFDTYV